MTTPEVITEATLSEAATKTAEAERPQTLTLSRIRVEFGGGEKTVTRECPCSGEVYMVEASGIPESTITELEEFVRLETRNVGLECGSSSGESFEDQSFRIAHILEHLTVVDLIKRGKVSMDREPIKMGMSVRTDGITIFWIRDGLVSPEEEEMSLGNAFTQITSNYDKVD